MTALTTARTLTLTDAAGNDLGTARVESVTDGLVLGDFTPGPGYPAVEPVFRHFAEVVEQQALAFADEAEAAIARLGIAVRIDGHSTPTPVTDVQIYPDGMFSCRIVTNPGENGAPP